MNEQLTIVPPEEMPQTDEPKSKRVVINQLQENLLKLLERDKCSLADVQKATMVPWPTIYGWYKGEVLTQLLDINIKEVADYFDVSVDFIAFGNKKYKFDTFDRQELFRLKDGEAS